MTAYAMRIATKPPTTHAAMHDPIHICRMRSPCGVIDFGNPNDASQPEVANTRSSAGIAARRARTRLRRRTGRRSPPAGGELFVTYVEPLHERRSLPDASGGRNGREPLS